MERVAWSSENHHLARARRGLSDRRLGRTGYGPEDRVLMWGHSHAGNVFAIATNLLAADAAQRESSFFAAGRCYYHQRWFGGLSKPVWDRVRQWLELPRDSRQLPHLDLVTFGTPIRYGWDSDGYAKLLHFVYHRPRSGVAEYRTTLPRSIEDLLHATDGDYVQQLGIAGTNLPPAGIGLRSWLADLRLARLLQPGLRRRDLFQPAKNGATGPGRRRNPAGRISGQPCWPDSSPGTRSTRG